ncbi:hypothetical protein E2C01_061072 [Portunus trituberculatus]|uniref:Uncharacterized protein n=1 Tax=Portunus trituberculatus TaxID=210409 RepID=A0A5B7HAD6_PORTR|nr:hypothetical protein [Portunus trituberculatus]
MAELVLDTQSLLFADSGVSKLYCEFVPDHFKFERKAVGGGRAISNTATGAPHCPGARRGEAATGAGVVAACFFAGQEVDAGLSGGQVKFLPF